MHSKEELSLSFEKALEELENIVRDLESGQKPLDHVVEAYKRGVWLRQYCESKLNQARLQVEQVVVSDTTVQLEPFDSKSEET